MEATAALFRDCDAVIVAGCGGGYDAFGGVPLVSALHAMGKRTLLANLSLTDARTLNAATGCSPLPGCTRAFVVQPDFARAAGPYFAEAELANAVGQPVLALRCSGALRAAHVADAYRCAAATVLQARNPGLCLVDGGCDVLLTGEEAGGLGTPTEDMTHLLAAVTLGWPATFVGAVGWNVDVGHGVDEAALRARVEGLRESSAVVRATWHAWHAADPNVAAYLAVLDSPYVTPSNTIVQSLVAAAVRGCRGRQVPQCLAGRLPAEDTVVALSDLTRTWLCLPASTLAAQVAYFCKLSADMMVCQVDDVVSDWLEARAASAAANRQPSCLDAAGT